MIKSKSEWFTETNVVFEQVLEQVAANLNEIHSVQHGTRYWNIFVGAWLQQFVDMVMLRMFDIERNTHIPATALENSPANSLKQFHEYSKLTGFVERLHYDTLFILQSNKITTATEKAASDTSPITFPYQKLGRSFVTASYHTASNVKAFLRRKIIQNFDIYSAMQTEASRFKRSRSLLFYQNICHAHTLSITKNLFRPKSHGVQSGIQKSSLLRIAIYTTTSLTSGQRMQQRLEVDWFSLNMAASLGSLNIHRSPSDMKLRFLIDT